MDLRRKACPQDIINIKLIKGNGTCVFASKDDRPRGGVKLKLELPFYERFKKSLSYVGQQLGNELNVVVKLDY